MCWVSICRHIINSQHSQQGVGGLGPFWLHPLRAHCVPWFSALLIQHPFCQHREGWGTDWFPEWTVSASKVVWLAPSTPTKFPTYPRSLWSTSPWAWWSAKVTGVGLRTQAATVMGSALRGTRMWEWGCLVVQQPQGDTMAVAKTPTCLLTGANAPALSVTSFQATTPHPSRSRNPPPLQETDTPAKALPLKIWYVGPSSTGGFVENAVSQALPQANWVRICEWTRSPGALCACSGSWGEDGRARAWGPGSVFLSTSLHFTCTSREGPLLLKNAKAGPARTGNLVIRTNGSQNGKWGSPLPVPKGTVPGPLSRCPTAPLEISVLGKLAFKWESMDQVAKLSEAGISGARDCCN